MSNDEVKLLHALRQGNREAFIALYDLHYAALYKYILKFVAIPEMAEDALQDVFIKIWEIRERINPQLSFSGYLYRISRNHVFKLLKKIAADEDLRTRVMREIGNQTSDADNRLLWKQYEALLQQAVSQLPPQRRRIFLLCREESKTYEEVALELGISKNTVKEHMVLALKSLKSFFYEHADEALLLLMIVDINQRQTFFS